MSGPVPPTEAGRLGATSGRSPQRTGGPWRAGRLGATSGRAPSGVRLPKSGARSSVPIDRKFMALLYYSFDGWKFTIVGGLVGVGGVVGIGRKFMALLYYILDGWKFTIVGGLVW